MPAWHPDLRIVAGLPDTKVVRTAFFINFAAISVVAALFLVLGHREWSLFEVHKQVSDLERNIDRDKKQSAEGVAMFAEFKKEEAKVSEVADFLESRPRPSEIILRLGQITPKRIAFDAIDIKAAGISIRATVKGAPDRASGDASSYEKQLRTDKVLGPLFSEVNLLTMRRNPATGRLGIELFCEFVKGGKKK